jgi:hypothetical protein
LLGDGTEHEVDTWFTEERDCTIREQEWPSMIGRELEYLREIVQGREEAWIAGGDAFS